jgi:hypothetical protein
VAKIVEAKLDTGPPLDRLPPLLPGADRRLGIDVEHGRLATGAIAL